MIITHKIHWDKCLSHQIWPAIEKGWPDEGRPVHFFWGLAGNNLREIKNCIERNEEWWYVDVGYLTDQITRYPEPKIHYYNQTYFRICKGNIHTINSKESDGKRVTKLIQQGINVEFKEWQSGEHILVCPSSPTVTYHINNMTQDDWIKNTINEIKKHTDKEVRLRNKPRPSNKWWNTDIKDDLKGAHCLVTNMSLSAVDAILYGVPCITDKKNVANPLSSQDISTVDLPFKPENEEINKWINMVANNQFTIREIEDGIAFKVLQEQI